MSKWPYSTQRWKRLRALKLAASPLCETCAPRVVPATQVDHLDDVTQGGDPFPPLDRLSSKCASCHSRKTSHTRVHGHDGVPVRGCDADGKPKNLWEPTS